MAGNQTAPTKGSPPKRQPLSLPSVCVYKKANQ